MATFYGTRKQDKVRPIHAKAKSEFDHINRYYSRCGVESTGADDETKVTCKRCLKILAKETI